MDEQKSEGETGEERPKEEVTTREREGGRKDKSWVTLLRMREREMERWQIKTHGKERWIRSQGCLFRTIRVGVCVCGRHGTFRVTVTSEDSHKHSSGSFSIHGPVGVLQRHTKEEQKQGNTGIKMAGG